MTDTNGSNAGIEAQRAKMAFLFREDVAPGLRLEMDLKKIFTSSESKFQQVDVVETYFGKVCMRVFLNEFVVLTNSLEFNFVGRLLSLF